jgi:aminopeptidase N
MALQEIKKEALSENLLPCSLSWSRTRGLIGSRDAEQFFRGSFPYFKASRISAMRSSIFILLFALFISSGAYAVPPPHGTVIDYTLHVRLDIGASKITGTATIPVQKERELTLSTGSLTILGVNLDGQKTGFLNQVGKLRVLPLREGILEISYEAVFTKSADRFNMLEPVSVIGSEGIFLTGSWYPAPEQLCIFRLTASLPEGYAAVSEAEMIEETTRDGRMVFAFSFPHPLGSIDLIATNRYKIVREDFRGVELYAYFFREDADLVPTYLEHAKKYLSLYDHLIIPFPYKRFSIVENFLPTGYSMPTFTLLGQEVVRLPFIPETSLGHEILHQWFGNLVYIDYEKGNWAEGLTTFLADYLYEEEKGKGREYRKSVLIDYMSYVHDKNEFPVRDFRERSDPASQAIGYGKTLMIFEMLRNLIGKEKFYDALRYFVKEMRFHKASWGDLQRAFEAYYRNDLDWFFHQWVDRKGLPSLALEDVKVRPWGDRFEVAFTIQQGRKVYRLDLPVGASSFGETARTTFEVHKEKDRGSVLLDDVPGEIAVDEGYEIARSLIPGEFPPVLSRLLGDQNPVIVMSPSGAGIYEEVVGLFRSKGARVKTPGEITFDDLKTSSLVILGVDNPWVGRLYGKVSGTAGFSVTVKENPWNAEKVAAIFHGRSKGEVKADFPKISHYGRYSLLSFDHGENVERSITPSASGITKELIKKAVAVEIPKLQALPTVMKGVAAKRIVYVGEIHDRVSNHVMELEIIKALHRRGKPIAIGMEMFQKPYQKALEEYIDGKIDERQFLKSTRYFEQWGFEYRLYRPILLFARAEKIPVVALNIQKEIADKVFRGGICSLSNKEKELLPRQMDFEDEAYRERLKREFMEHEHLEQKALNFDFFYQAQVLWDETMAESIDTFLRSHPGYQMVVLAGDGHLAYGSGIPKRTVRRNGYDYAIVLNDSELKGGIADYVLLPGTIPGETSPQLMVLVREEMGRLVITGFPPDSPSERAGMRAGDVILSIDGTPVGALDDIKIDLVTKEHGDRVDVKVSRKSSFGMSKEMNFEVVLP